MDRLTNLLSPRAWAALVFAVVLGVALAALLGWCAERGESRRQRQDAALGEGRTRSAVEAIGEIGRLEARGQATREDVKEAQDAIRQADPAERDRVARLHLCRLQHRADCDGLFGPGRADPDPGDATR